MSQADRLIVNARVWSEGRTLAGVDSVAILAGRILAVGSAADVSALAGPSTQRLDAAGCTVTPGLCDAHLHLVSWARARQELALEGLTSRREVLERVAHHGAANSDDEPLIGRGWDEHGWEAPPTAAALDQAAPGRAVILHRKDFHAVWVSGAALERAGVTAATPDPAGGKIERLPTGEPSGVFREHAVRLFRDLIHPSRSPPISRAAVPRRRSCCAPASPRCTCSKGTARRKCSRPTLVRRVRGCGC